MKKKILVVFFACVALFTVAACSQNALGKLVASEQTRVTAQNNKGTSPYASVKVTSEGTSTIVYTYTFKLDVDKAAMASLYQMPAEKVSQQTALDDTIFPEMLGKGIKNPKAKNVYLTKDGKTIVSLTFEPSKTVKAAT
ncbi:MAG: DUF4854 domain-containing protein [Streptococcaceae bacterium]|jgi:hypothetical protein|nr:DUF4854 domain-containing protein [Streptococcaceae bacterium]